MHMRTSTTNIPDSAGLFNIQVSNSLLATVWEKIGFQLVRNAFYTISSTFIHNDLSTIVDNLRIQWCTEYPKMLASSSSLTGRPRLPQSLTVLRGLGYNRKSLKSTVVGGNLS